MFGDLSLSGEFYSLLCAIVWAVAVVFFRRSGDHAAPNALNLFKNTVGFLAFVVTMLLLGEALVPSDASALDWGQLLLSGALGIGVADSLFFASLNRLGAGGNAVVDCLYSPLIVLFAWLFLDESISMILLGGVGCMVAAILVATWDPTALGVGADRKTVIAGVIFGIFAMIGMAGGIVLAKPVLNHTDVLWASTVRLAGGILMLLAMTPMKGNLRSYRFVFTPGPHWKLLVPVSLWGTYLAMMIWIAGMKYTDTSVASVLNQTSVLWVPFLAYFVLKERLTGRKLIAILLGFIGAVLAVF